MEHYVFIGATKKTTTTESSQIIRARICLGNYTRYTIIPEMDRRLRRRRHRHRRHRLDALMFALGCRPRTYTPKEVFIRDTFTFPPKQPALI